MDISTFDIPISTWLFQKVEIALLFLYAVYNFAFSLCNILFSTGR